MNKFVRTKSRTVSKFSKIFLEQLYTDGATTDYRAPNLKPRFLVNFVPVWGMIASPIMHRFGHCFRPLLRDLMRFVAHYAFRRSVCRWRHKSQLETKASSPAGQCIPAGHCHAHMLLYVSGVNCNVNSKYTKYFAQLCGRISTFRNISTTN